MGIWAWRIVAVGLAVTLVGCGSGGSSGSSKAEGPSLAEQYRRALKMSAPEGRAKELVRIALKQDSAGDTGGADRSLTDAAAACDEITDPLGKASALNNVAEGQARLKQTTAAAKSLREVRRLLDGVEAAESQGAKTTELCKMGVIYGRDLEKADLAKMSFQAAEEMTGQLEQAADKIAALAELAYSFDQAKLSDDSARLLTQALDAARGAGDPRQQADGLSAVAGRLGMMGKADQAKEVFNEATTAANGIEDPYGRAHALLSLSSALSRAGQKSEARKLLDQVEQVSEKISDQGFRTEITTRLDVQRRQT